MAVYSLPVFDISYISTSNPSGFDDNGGYQFDLGTDTVTIDPGAVSQVVSVTDIDDTFDDDEGASQVLNGPYTINGVSYPDGTVIEAEYDLEVQDGSGTRYTMQFVSLNADAFTIHGFVVQGPMPPWNTPLTVVQNYDNQQGVYQYSTAMPACFDLRARIATTNGPIEASRLVPGMRLVLADGGTAVLRLTLRSTTCPALSRDGAPVRLRAGALGPGCPDRDLILSPQHRVLVPGARSLAPAKALSVLPRIGRVRNRRRIDYVHLVLDRHALILAEGVVCESFWPGSFALRQLPPARANRVRAVMGPNPVPARPFLTVRAARALLRSGRLTDPLEDV